MTLPSGVYIIENVRNHNWAILTNDNDGDDVISGTDADTDSGHKWEVQKLHNGTYLLCNQQFRNYATYKLTDVDDHPTVISTRDCPSNRWRINGTDGQYWISDEDVSRCWTLKYNHPETPITLEKYTYSDYQHWQIVPEDRIDDPPTRVREAGAIPRSAAKPRTALRKRPPLTHFFTGRRDILSMMHEYFFSDIGKRHVFVLHGLGGIGKSQITLKFIAECLYDTKPNRFSHIFFVDASSKETIIADLKNIAQAKGVGDSDDDALQWLSGLIEEWLLFFDNADDTTLNIGDYFPEGDHGNIIITSRNRETRIHASDKRSDSEVSCLTPEDAINLLVKIARVTADQASETSMLAASIVEELGHLALAVVQAGAYICKSGCGLVHYLEMYRERRTEFLKEYQVQKIDKYKWTVYTTWTVSFEKLSEREATFLNICSFFHHDGISVELFRRAAANIETRIREGRQTSSGLVMAKEFLASFRSEDGHWSLYKFMAVVSEIRKYSLIDFDETNDTCSIHPLVHDWTRSRVSDFATVHECSQVILTMSIDEAHDSEDIAFRRTLLPHIDASLRCGTPTDPDVAAFLWRPYYEGGRWKKAAELQDLVLKAKKRDLGEGHPETLAIMANLAATYLGQGRLEEAEKLQAKEMEVRKRVLGDEDPDLPAKMCNLASTYWMWGRLEEAANIQVEAMELRKRGFGDDDPGTLAIMSNLATTYFSLGRWREAEDLEYLVMKARERDLGDKHPDTLTSMSNLAITYSNLGRVKEAEELEVKVMVTRKQTLGEDHPDTLTSVANLASMYSSQGRWKEAEGLEEQVMETRKRVLGDEHPDTLTSMSNLAFTYSRQGRLQEAEELGLRVWEMKKRILGEYHSDTLLSMSNLASTYSRQGRLKEAESLELQVIVKARKVLGDEHPETLIITSKLATMYSSQGRWQEAEELETQVMETRMRTLGEDHPDTLTSMSNLSWIYSGQGRQEEAEELLTRVVQLSKAALGDDHPDTVEREARLSELTAGDQIQDKL